MDDRAQPRKVNGKLPKVMLAVSILLVACAICIFAVSLWALLSNSVWTYFMPESDVQKLKDGAIILITAGCLLFLTSLVACLGCLLQIRLGLIVTVVANVIVVILLITGGSLRLSSRMEDSEEVRDTVQTALQTIMINEYGQDLQSTDVIDEIQNEGECCAVMDQHWSLYRRSVWYNEQPGTAEGGRPMVPESCCVREQSGEYKDPAKCQTYQQGPPGRVSGQLNDALHYRGCLEQVWGRLINKQDHVGPMGIAFGVILIPIEVLYLLLIRKMK